MAAPAQDRNRRLGRGLDFLLSPTGPEIGRGEQVEIEISRIQPNPWQPRSDFDEESLQSLADSIRRHGVIQPVVLRRRDDRFELVAGERRVLAAKRAGLTKVPAVVRTLDDTQMLLVALVENVQRSDLNPIDRAQALKRLVDEHAKSHEEVAAISGLARSTVTNSLRLLELDPGSTAAIRSGRISEGHARALLAEPDVARRAELLESIINDKLSVRKAEEVSSQAARGKRSGRRPPSENAKRLGKLLSERLRTRVRIVERGPRGRLELHYTSLREFERIFELLAGEPPPIE